MRLELDELDFSCGSENLEQCPLIKWKRLSQYEYSLSHIRCERERRKGDARFTFDIACAQRRASPASLSASGIYKDDFYRRIASTSDCFHFASLSPRDC